ncbi:MAG: RiPP maturation radical SAM C-methyltransferase [Pyrinomonadaceae bacterium]
MYRICLINMPFAALYFPSIALTQIKSIAEDKFAGEVEVDIAYVNHDFARYIGIGLYTLISTSMDAHTSGIGDWLFRREAFPHLEDNQDAYFKRYFPRGDQETLKIKEIVLDIKSRLPEFFSQMVKKYDLDRVDMVGLTSMFTQNVACFAMAERVKRTNPKAVTVMGGANCEAPMGQEIVRHVPQIDHVFSGPSLISFPELLRRQLDPQSNFHGDIKGVFSKRRSALPMLDCKGDLGEELPIDVDVRLDYDPFIQVMHESFPQKEVQPVLLFETSRGCWWGEKAHCTFCGLNGSSMAYRAMDPEKALAQFDTLFKYADDCKRFDAVDNILPKNYLTDVLPRLKTPSGSQIFYEVKADLSEEEMQILANSGVRSIQPGIEALATSTLKLMRKGTSVFTNLLLLKNCITYQIYPYWNLLVGFPGEGEEVYRKYMTDLPLLTHLPPPSGAFPVRFDRYSPYFTKAQEYGLDLHPLQYYRLTYPFPEESLNNLAYYFADSNMKAKYFVDMANWIGKLKGLVTNWAVRWHNQDATQRPKLYFKQTGDSTNVIYDSRGERPVEYAVSDSERRLLETLNSPGRPLSVARSLDITPAEAEASLASLQSKNLLFQEGDRYLSLVFQGEPALTSFA